MTTVWECAGCGKLFWSLTFEVHHKEPMNGNRVLWSPLHRQDNLEAVCHACHWGPDRHGKRLVPKEQAALL